MTPPLPAGYSARRPTLADADGIAALANTCTATDGAAPMMSAVELRAIWEPPGHDSTTDEWLIFAPDAALVGVGRQCAVEPYDEVFAFGVVHPQHQGRGLGTWLLT